MRGKTEDLRPAFVGGIEVAAGFKQAGMFDVGWQEVGMGLVELVEMAEGGGVVGELGFGDGLGQQSLGLFDARIGGGNGGEGTKTVLVSAGTKSASSSSGGGGLSG